MFPMFSPNLLVFSHLSPISRVFPHSPQLFSLFFLVPQVLSRCQGAEFSVACCSSASSANSATASRSMLSWTVPCRKIRKMHWWFMLILWLKIGIFYGIDSNTMIKDSTLIINDLGFSYVTMLMVILSDLDGNLHTHRIHGAALYANIKGVYWWDLCYHIYIAYMDPMGYGIFLCHNVNGNTFGFRWKPPYGNTRDIIISMVILRPGTVCCPEGWNGV